jgi:nicotinamide-nucleotide amidase
LNLRNKAKTLGIELSRRLLTVSFAESCTGGLISAHITEFSGASKYFLGSVVGYANEAKRDLLGVSERTLKLRGAVSKEVALAMAQGARKRFRSDWAVSVTGLAGPNGGSLLKPVGLVFFAVVGPKFEMTEKRNFKGSRKKIQIAAADEALSLLLRKLK